jgi:integrase
LSGVTHAGIAKWVATMRADGLSASRVRQSYHLFGSMLDAAVRDRRISTNPATGVKLPRLPETELRYLTHEQLHALASECGSHETLVLLLGYSGIRWGEAAALRVKRVDTMRGRLTIAEATTEVGGRIVHGTPKSHATARSRYPASSATDSHNRSQAKSPTLLYFRRRVGACSASATSGATASTVRPAVLVSTGSCRMSYGTRRRRSRSPQERT